MKNVKKLIICGATLCCAAVSALTGCTAPAAPARTISSNWYKNTSFGAIQDDIYNNHEKLTYALTFTNGENKYYSVHYNESLSYYKTDFYAMEYNWNDNKIPQEYRKNLSASVYVLETELHMEGTYQLGKATKDFSDTTVTKCYFRSVDEGLRPVYSYKEMNTTAPASYTPQTLEQCYVQYDYVTESFYNYDLTEVTTTITDKNDTISSDSGSASRKEKKATKGEVYDNNMVYLLMRASNYQSAINSAVSVYTPINAKIESTTLSVDTSAVQELSKDNTAFKAMLNKQYCNSEANLNISPVTFKLADATTGGQIAWFVNVDSNTNNTARSTMVKLEVPLYFGLGSLTFELNAIDSCFHSSI